MSLVSVFDVFKLAIGPSSSHTFGALRIGNYYNHLIQENHVFGDYRIKIELLGSFASTGFGHLTHYAIISGLNGYQLGKTPENIIHYAENIIKKKIIMVGNQVFHFDFKHDLELNTDNTQLKHPNTVRLSLLDRNDQSVLSAEYLSVGGGSIEGPNIQSNRQQDGETDGFTTMNEVLRVCEDSKIDLLEFVLSSEINHYKTTEDQVMTRMINTWKVMSSSIDQGLQNTGKLPGSLNLTRRANGLYSSYVNNIRQWKTLAREISLASIYAIAVAEENACGNLLITAPTCGSAGVIPGTFRVIQNKYMLSDQKIAEALMISGLIGSLIIKNASISGAEVGCQGEIGSASSMAAAGICYLLGGTSTQIESAAEIALEHHLGLPCDPIAGLVQIPCIERNGVGAVSALNAANLAILSNQGHYVSFDKTVRVMRKIGLDMNSDYKETSRGGLATEQ